MLRPPPARNPALEARYLERGFWLAESFCHYFERACKRFAGRTMIVGESQRLTGQEILERVGSTARGLAEMGIGRGSVVTVQLPNWWETVIIDWAVMRLGAVLNPVLPAFRERELEFMLKEGGSEVLVVPGRYRKADHRAMAASLAERIPRLRTVVVRDPPLERQIAFPELSQPSADALPPPPRGEDLLLLMYTSGTTSEPKGALHSHRTLLYEIRTLAEVHSLTDRDAILMPSPLAHVSGLIHAVLAPFVLGTRAVLMETWDPDRALELISQERVTYMVGAPIFLSDLAFHPRAGAMAKTLRLFSCGGAGVSPELIRESRERLGCLSKRVYGSTEYPTLTTTGPDDPVDRGASTEGRPIGAAEVRIVDDADRVLGPGGEGEIEARGPDCFLGYRNPALDAEAFTTDGWFRTGDLGFVDDGGYLTVTGRKKDIVIRKGEKISAPEIEALIARHPGVAEVAVIPLPDPVTGERACACLRLRDAAAPFDLAELCRFLRTFDLPSHKLPEALEIVAELPRTASGKVQKNRLRDEILAREKPGAIIRA